MSAPSVATAKNASKGKPSPFAQWVTGQGVTIVYFIAVLAVWEASVRIFNVASYVLPPPTSVVRALVRNWSGILDHTWATIISIVLGFVIGTVLGAVSAILISLSSVMRLAILPSLVALQSLPKITLAPLMTLWLGFGLASKVGMGAVFCFFPVLINMLTGLDRVDPGLLDLSRVLKAGRWRSFMKVRLPHSIPFLIDGMKIAMPMAVVGAIVAEFTGARQGLGVLIKITASQLNTDIMFAGILVSTTVALIFFRLIHLVEQFSMPWRRSGNGDGVSVRPKAGNGA